MQLEDDLASLFTAVAKCHCYLRALVLGAGGVTGDAGKPNYDSGFVELASVFLKGQILYTPENQFTQNIISQVIISVQLEGTTSTPF